MSDDGLFALPAGAVRPARPDDPVTAAQKLLARQRRDLRAGVHPLGMGVLHVQAAPYDDKDAPGLRCGTCAHRRPGRFPKCDLVALTHGAATDCRRWWPACRRHEPAPDPKGSPGDR